MRSHTPCKTCGQVHERCAAHRKSDGQPCGRWPKKGLPVCRQCGGAAPQVQDAGERRLHEAEVRAVAQRHLDDPEAGPMEDPADRLLCLASRVQNAVDAVGERVNRLNELSIETSAGGEQIKAEVQVWDKLLGRLHAILVDVQKLGLKERQVKVEEVQAAILAQGLTWLQGEARLRLDLSEVESRVFSELLGEMLGRLDDLESEGTRHG